MRRLTSSRSCKPWSGVIGSGKWRSRNIKVRAINKEVTSALTSYSVLESATTLEDASRAVAEVKLERARVELALARKVADRRSGARGAEARKALLAAEARLREAEER